MGFHRRTWEKFSNDLLRLYKTVWSDFGPELYAPVTLGGLAPFLVFQDIDRGIINDC